MTPTNKSIGALILAAMLAMVNLADARINKNAWFYPFAMQTCTGCAVLGNVLPWCIKVPVTNLYCPVNQAPQKLPTCIRINGTQVVGSVAHAVVADSLSPTATVNPSTLTCDDGQPTVELPSCISVGASAFPNGLPAEVIVSSSSIATALSQSTIQVSQLACSGNTPLPSCATISATQVTTGALPVGVTISTSQLTCPSGSSTFPSCWAVPGGQISGGVIGTSTNFTGQITGTTACNSVRSCLATSPLSPLYSAPCAISGTTIDITCPGTTRLLAACPLPQELPYGCTGVSGATASSCGTYTGCTCTAGTSVTIQTVLCG